MSSHPAPSVSGAVGADKHKDIAVDFPPEMPYAEVVRSGKKFIESAHRRVLETNLKSPPRTVMRLFTRFHDDLFRALHRHLVKKWEANGAGAPGSLCIIALGGYGRRDLCLCSDLDLLFLIGPKAGRQEAFVKEFLHVLFDWKLEVGYAVRRQEDCLESIGVDIESATAMLESRYLIGSRPLWQHFHEVFVRTLRGSGRRWYLASKEKEWEERLQKSDASVYLLEPNIKESAGGLRDLHSLQWVLTLIKGAPELSQLVELEMCTELEYKQLRQAEEFMLRLRNELHAISPRKTDVLTFGVQVELAARLGYKSNEQQLGEEQLMRHYYRRARRIWKFCSRSFFMLVRFEKSRLGTLIGSLRRKKIDRHFFSQSGVIFLDRKHEDYFRKDPRRIMELFARARRSSLRVSPRTLDAIERLVPELGSEVSEDPSNHKNFIEILKGRSGVARTLSDMHDSGFLCLYMPEFENVRCMVRMDHYHRYTVDEHLLKSVAMVEELLSANSAVVAHAGEIAARVKRLDLLHLALLLHDVGKGHGKGHAIRGGQIIQRVGQRMGFDEDDIEILRFLVLSHLKINHAAQRRDLEDPRVALDLAGDVGSSEKLDLLYIHSVCDLMAVSPDAMNEWKATLYETLYRVTAARFGDKNAASPPPSGHRKPLADKVVSFLESQTGEKRKSKSWREDILNDVLSFLKSVPERYVQTTHPEYIAEHFEMVRRLDEKTCVLWKLDAGQGSSQLTVCSSDVPGSFAMTCGALAVKDINVLSAQIFSTLDGHAINRFEVSDWRGLPLPTGFRLERLRSDLNQVFLGRKSMEELFAKYHKHLARRPPRHAPRPIEIRIDNEASDHFTILEIRAGDRPGLLYSIATQLDRHKLNIHRAMLTSEAYGVVDVFYLTDLEYNKLRDDAEIGRLREDLEAALEDQARPLEGVETAP